MFDREGRPLAIVKSTPGKGLYVFLPFRMNTTWTDLPLRNSFLPLLMELIQKKDFFQKEKSLANPSTWRYANWQGYEF